MQASPDGYSGGAFGVLVHRQTRNHELIGELYGLWAQHISVPHTGAKSSNSDVRSLSHLHVSLLTFTSHRVSQLRPGGSTCTACQTTSRRQYDRPLSFLATTQLCIVQPHSLVHSHATATSSPRSRLLDPIFDHWWPLLRLSSPEPLRADPGLSSNMLVDLAQ